VRYGCLSLVGVEATAPRDLATQRFAVGRLAAVDVCLLISHSGATRPLLQLAGAAAAQATTIGLTSLAGSPLATVVAIPLIAGAMGTGFPLEAMASRVAHQIVIDALYIAVAERTRPRSTRALDLAAAITAGATPETPHDHLHLAECEQ